MAQHFDRDKRSIAALNRQAKAGDAEAMAELGLRFFLGRGGAKRDTLKGLDWSERAIRVGDRQALRNLVTLMRVLPALDVYRMALPTRRHSSAAALPMVPPASR